MERPAASHGDGFPVFCPFDFLTVEENVAFGLKQHTHMLTDDIKLRVRDLLSSVGLSGNEKAYPAELSGE